MNIMIAGGGTGGHIFPAVALAEAFKRRFPEVRITFVGTRYGMETTLIPKAGYPLRTLPVRGFLGKGLLGKAALLWRLPAGMLLSLWLLARYRPKLVVGVGGYASGPLVFVAALLRIPTMIQEQNAFPGVTNRLASKVARVALCGFAEAARYLKCPVIHTGNPVRTGFRNSLPWSADRPDLLVLGGSQGARALNRVLPELLRRTLNADGPSVVHQCGARYVDEVKAAYAGAPFPVTVTPFIDDMGSAFNRARLVVCRAGAGTLAELAQVGVPALLVPFPNAAHDHQTYNAESLAAHGAVRLIREADLAEAGDIFTEVLSNPEILAKMASAYPPVQGDAADRCVAIGEGLIQGREVAELVEEFRTHV